MVEFCTCKVLSFPHWDLNAHFKLTFLASTTCTVSSDIDHLDCIKMILSRTGWCFYLSAYLEIEQTANRKRSFFVFRGIMGITRREKFEEELPKNKKTENQKTLDFIIGSKSFKSQLAADKYYACLYFYIYHQYQELQ